MREERLHKVMAACGAGSRRECETFIAEGRVRVDGELVDTPGTLVDPQRQTIHLDDELLRVPPRFYYLLNKPRGVICSQRTHAGGLRAVDFAPPEADDHRLFTIGRLDVDSQGALILTNDGDLCHLVSHPRFQVQKTYRVEVSGTPDDETLGRMRRGVWLAEGRTASLEIKVGPRRRDRTILFITLNEGMKREIRRVCARFGHPVRKLERLAIGPIELGKLKVGEVRPLTPDEIEALRKSAEVVIRLGGGGSPRRQRNARKLGQGGQPREERGRPVRGRRQDERGPRGGRSGGRSGGRRGNRSGGGRSGRPRPAKGKGGRKR